MIAAGGAQSDTQVRCSGVGELFSVNARAEAMLLASLENLPRFGHRESAAFAEDVAVRGEVFLRDPGDDRIGNDPDPLAAVVAKNWFVRPVGSMFPGSRPLMVISKSPAS